MDDTCPNLHGRLPGEPGLPSGPGGRFAHAGFDIHATTQRAPGKFLTSEELPARLPVQADDDVPLFKETKVYRGDLIEVCKALYSVPGNYTRAHVAGV